jgi:hypothetical protein
MTSHSRLSAASSVSCAAPASPITFMSGISERTFFRILPDYAVIICIQHIHCPTSESLVGRKDLAGG